MSGQVEGADSQREFKTLGEAFEFLDKEREELERMMRLYHGHVKELMAQILAQLDAGKAP